jgi:hypothetical protein
LVRSTTFLVIILVGTNIKWWHVFIIWNQLVKIDCVWFLAVFIHPYSTLFSFWIRPRKELYCIKHFLHILGIAFSVFSVFLSHYCCNFSSFLTCRNLATLSRQCTLDFDIFSRQFITGILYNSNLRPLVTW